MLKTSFILAAALCALSVPADAAPSPASICAPVKAQQQTFSQFCEGFKPLNAGTFGVEAFGTTDASKVSDIKSKISDLKEAMKSDDLDKIKSAPHSHTNPAEKNQK